MVRRLWVLIETEHHVRYVAAIFPEPQPAGGEHLRGSDRTHDVVHAGEEMDEQIACHAGAVVLIVAPAEEPDRRKRHLRRAAQEAVPINGGWRGICRDRILPGANGGGPVPPGLHHVHFADGSLIDELLGLLI